ncbi:hypothetical protein [Bacteroides acidifaciens]|uniref:hypothetical protein n=1 Tax=Bacteroides acidifaciens TaxID=85831 RepID=UPI00263B0260|nr:hypothetical protein [Bacteroides acidifaciens]
MANTKTRVYIKNSAESEKLFNYIFESDLGKSLSEILEEVYAIKSAHLPLENNTFTIVAFCLSNSHIKVDIDESIVSEAMQFDTNDCVYIGAPFSAPGIDDFVSGSRPIASPSSMMNKNIDSIIVSDWIMLSYTIYNGDAFSSRHCTAAVFKDFVTEDASAIQTIELVRNSTNGQYMAAWSV